ncbi:hypothetical protein GTCCBUS3UF5_3820 [Geobacillus thermoleovorans CCB_US3_UF5]|uniref:Uncharacterized protein n=3 Tax=Geobacillus TaxID=129337 RepID=A0A1Q5T4Y7_9BACL|nr:hypothetical protein GTCCBUS3UF5_3820 [Geobacillus thermoleovorans CCB_US3_UF5]OKO95293.1 hypothetical protein BRO54_1098 [Geobacillus proteiniphilus]GAD15271.1 hypothetical protein GBL_3488 [Geobacillus kaustophilus GBlys]GAJ60326.1 hypothetical protein B23_3571 [Geobacillus thermoleovorans B23]
MYNVVLFFDNNVQIEIIQLRHSSFPPFHMLIFIINYLMKDV